MLKSQKNRVGVKNQVGVMLVIISAMGFGTLAIFGKLAYAQGLNPLSTLVWRLGGAAIAIWIWLLLRNQWQVKRQAAIAAFLVGAFGYAIQSVLFFCALDRASAGMTALMFYTYPVFVAFFSWVFSRKHLSSWQMKALGLALLGCLLTVDLTGQAAQPLGIVLGIASGGAYALYLLCSARLIRSIPPITTAAYMLLGAALSVTLVTIIWQGLDIPSTVIAVGTVSSLAIVATALPIVTLFAGLKRLGVIPAAILSTLEPLMAVLMGIMFLGEQIWLGQVLGGALIIGSGLILQANPRN